MDARPSSFARLRAMADFPVPHWPWRKITLCPSLMASMISLTISSWVLPLENFSGGKSSPLFLWRDQDIEKAALFVYIRVMR